METPSSARRVTRSQIKVPLNSTPTSKKNETETEKVLSKRKTVKPDRSVLIDITNDSPIVGLAMEGLKTPSSLAKKKDWLKQQTPGTGEALLRGQVKTLLQKVEEEAEISKLSFEHRPFIDLEGVTYSPSGLLAPTPANTPYTPHLLKLSCDGNGVVVTVMPSEVQEECKIAQEEVMTVDGLKKETLDSPEYFPLRTFEEQSGYVEKSIQEDDASVWSIHANTSTQDEGEGEGNAQEDEEDYDQGELVDQLCEGLSKISVQDKKMPKCLGVHTRFVYNSEDEIEGEEVIRRSPVSPGVLLLKGMPTPEGKHLRFPEVEEEED